MESILARALEYTLKYWLKSFTRDQFKLQGRTAQLSNLDINGDALHASLGLPPALHVTTAKVGKLEILLPSVSNVQVEPIVVQIDRLDLVLEENDDLNASSTANSTQSPASSAKGSGYGFADKIADGMTIEVRTVNLLLETRSARSEGGATWASPIASITMRNLSLYTTNENWQVVNLKEVRDFFTNKKFIYVFKKLEWEYLSIDLLPHPDMFAAFASFQDGSQKKDNDGAKRVFFGGERFIEGIAGEAYITIQRTDLNTALGLEVQLHITEVVCPALSEPGLRALLRFFTGLYVCLNRGDVNPNAQQLSTEAAGRSLVSIIVDHIFLCVKDAEFQLELLMQSLFFSRASDSDGENAKYLTQVMLGGLFLRDTLSRPPCTLVQPSMQTADENVIQVPDFANDFLPPIYPLGDERWRLHNNVPLISLHSLQLKPSPSPPQFTSQTVICCLPLMIHLQQESCLRISSFIADGVVVNPADLLPDFSINSLEFRASGFDVTVPMETGNFTSESPFAGARLHIENMFFTESPSLKLKLLNLEKDPACYSLWEDQPIDASQKKWTAGSSLISLSLETGVGNITKPHSELWRCVEFKGASIEAAMATADGSPLINVPPPGGIVRVGVSCQQYLSNTSVEQFFFVLDLYEYFCRVSEKIVGVGKENDTNENNIQFLGSGNLIEKVPGDTAVTVAVNDILLSFLEASSIYNDVQGMPLVKFGGENLFVKVSHRTLGGALAISSSLNWHKVQVDCADTESPRVQLRPVFWVQEERNRPLLDINMVSVIPYSVRDMECHSVSVSACIAGVRLGGGMNYTEALLHRFGILGPDGGPARELSKGLQRLYKGPLSTLFNPQPLPLVVNQRQESNGSFVDEEESSGFMQLGTPDDMDVSVELKDWLFALEGADDTSSERLISDPDNTGREVRCWQTTFRSLKVKAKASPICTANGTEASHHRQRFPIELVTVGVEGLKTLKPNAGNGTDDIDTIGGVNVEADILVSEEDTEDRTLECVVENFKFSVKQPIEAVVTKDELQHLAVLCKSEVESMGRIALGALKVLKLEGSIGQSTINQLSNLGNGGYDLLFTPEKLSREGSGSSIVPSPSTTESPHPFVESTFASLEEALLDSQANCSTLLDELCDSQKHTTSSITVQQLHHKLESMHKLLKQLRTQI